MMPAYTPLNRREIPIQIKPERDDGCQAVVPVHPAVFELRPSVLNDEGIMRDALEAARSQFDVESRAYIEGFKAHGYSTDDPLRLEDYRRFDDKWSIDFSRYRGFTSMRWKEANGTIGLCPAVCVSNSVVLKDSGRRPALEELEIAPNVAIIYGSIHTYDFFLLPKEVLLEYESKQILPEMLIRRKEHDNGWAIDLVVDAFVSPYMDNVPQALLFRNWAVEYNNRLLEKAATPSSRLPK